MAPAATRYPGAQSFTDDPVSRAVFFGRAPETRALTDQVLAHRLVVVYAKSGLGKTSLLQAGVAQLLRDEGYLPVFVRLNVPRRDPIDALLSSVAETAAAAGVEYAAGDPRSLWHFFKTAECWRGDRLLVPVLVLDQFEELFTLHGREARASFLSALGHLVRGVRPDMGEARDGHDPARLSDTPPALRVVVSLREDYLGALEEAADNIPQILDHRFRLTPLTVEAALEAIERPARLDDERFATRPFTFRSGTVRAILDYLTKTLRGVAQASRAYVEPFHLQLICQRVERLVAARQRAGQHDVQISLDDLGGERGLKATLHDFYKEVLQSIDSRRTRRRVGRLCEQYLISPEGRRLSLERGEIRRILKLDGDTLQSLVDRRLLRSDQRADSWYYELSHDSLVGPILATRRAQGIALGLFGFIGSLIVGMLAIGMLAGPAVMAFVMREEPAIAAAIVVLFLIIGALTMWMCVIGLRRSVESLNRYIAPPS